MRTNEHGLLFQPDMARANVAGLKTMTRRGNALKEINANPDAWRFDGIVDRDEVPHARFVDSRTSIPVGYQKGTDILRLNPSRGEFLVKFLWQVGDLIYQKETWKPMNDLEGGGIPRLGITWGKGVTFKAGNPDQSGPWKSSLFLEKRFARFWAEIISIKVERVRDISAEDCIKEGLSTTLREHDAVVHLRDQYRILYDRINGASSFERDWCWVIEYREVKR